MKQWLILFLIATVTQAQVEIRKTTKKSICVSGE